MPNTKREHTVLLALALAILDTACVCTAYVIAAYWARTDGQPFGEIASGRLVYLAVFAAVWCGVAVEERLFVSRRHEALVPQLFRLGKGLVLAAVFSIFLLGLMTQDWFDRSFALIFAGAMALSIFGARTAMRLSLWGLRRRGYNYRRILIIGANSHTAHLAEVILSHEQYGFQIEGFLEDDEGRRPLLERYRLPYLGPIERLEQLLVDRVIDRVYISLPIGTFYERIQSIAHLCEGIGVPVRLVANIFTQRSAAHEITMLADVPLVTLSGESDARAQFALRRATDFLVSSMLLVVLSPLLFLIAVLIKAESRGPVFQLTPCADERRGAFNLVRFRCTTANTPSELTRVGRFLLQQGLDELPELLNVWRGQLSLVNPLPASFHSAPNAEANAP